MGVLSEIQVPVRMEAWLPEAHSPLWETQAHMLGSLQAMNTKPPKPNDRQTQQPAANSYHSLILDNPL